MFCFHYVLQVRGRLKAAWPFLGTMRIQLKVRRPEGSDFKLVDLCDSPEELKRMTVADMKEKLSKQLGLGSYHFFFLIIIIV